MRQRRNETSKIQQRNEFKTTTCPNTGAIRYMEILWGKEEMKPQKFNEEIRDTAGCTLCLLLYTIPFEKEGVWHGIRGVVLFSSVLTANEVAVRGHDGVSKSSNTMHLF